MRLAGISTAKEANAFLDAYRVKFNKRFAKSSRETQSAWRPVPRGMDVAETCAFRHEAVVSNYNFLSIDGLQLQIPRTAGGRTYAKAKVQFRQLLTGEWRLKHQGNCIGTLTTSAEWGPDVIFLDIGLPGMDGYDVAREITRRGGPRPMLVALTGYGQASDRGKALDAGFDQHLVKPASLTTIERVLDSLQSD